MLVEDSRCAEMLTKANRNSAGIFAPQLGRPEEITSPSGVKRRKHHIKYRLEFSREAARLMTAGYKKWQIAKAFSVCTNTMRNWMAKYPEFAMAMGTADITREYQVVQRHRKQLTIQIAREDVAAQRLFEKLQRNFQRAGREVPSNLRDVAFERLVDLGEIAKALDRRISSLERRL